MGYNKIEALAAERGLSVEQLLTQEIERHKTIMRAAAKLDLSPNTLKYNLKKCNLKVISITKVVKE